MYKRHLNSTAFIKPAKSVEYQSSRLRIFFPNGGIFYRTLQIDHRLVLLDLEQDKSSDIEQQPPFGDRK